MKRTLNVSPGLEKFQRVMLTLLPKVILPGFVRVSLGISNSEEEVDELIRMLGHIAAKSTVPQSDVKQKVKDFLTASATRVYLKP